MINSNINQTQRKRIKQNKLIYVLNYEDQTASIVNNDEASGNLFIEKSVEHEGKEFIIKSINERSFENNKSIQSIEFSNESEITIIKEEAFLNCNIESLHIPRSINKLSDGWCRGTSKLTNIKIDPNNETYINLDNKMIIGKTSESNKEYEELIFVRRDIENLIIPTFIKRICKYSISETSIRTVFISSNIIEIDEGSFYNSQQLCEIEISNKDTGKNGRQVKNVST